MSPRLRPEAMAPAQAVIDEAMARAKGECAVLVEEISEAEVRFANNTMTTNGVRRDRRVTVVAFAPVDGGTAAGTARAGGTVDIAELVAAAEAAAAAKIAKASARAAR